MTTERLHELVDARPRGGHDDKKPRPDNTKADDAMTFKFPEIAP
jgi:hypothetical protein